MSKIRFVQRMHVRWYSVKEKMKVVDTIDELITKNEMKPRKHPGIVGPKFVAHPTWLLKTVQDILIDNNLKPVAASESAMRLTSHLHGRHAPIEQHEFKAKAKAVKAHLISMNVVNEEDDVDVKNNRIGRILLKKNIYHWTPVCYDKPTSISYLVGKSVQDYTVLYKILNEINVNDPEFKPETLFDFGSGVGTVMWAASHFWSNSLKEYFCVDVSQEMHELSRHIMNIAQPSVKSHQLFYRQFFPAAANPNYDIVVSAYTLLELPSLKLRLEAVSKLWRKTNKYLVIIEHGTNVGFEVVNEARDYILNYECKKTDQAGHVFSPCPHDLSCPRLGLDNTPCNFETQYATLPISGPSKVKKERYSYVVLKKGERPETDSRWPRIVRPTLVRSKHVICRLCNSSGKLEEHIFTAWKNGKNTYRCAKKSNWGDRLPVRSELVEEEEEKEEDVKK